MKGSSLWSWLHITMYIILNSFWIWGLWRGPWWHVSWGKYVGQSYMEVDYTDNLEFNTIIFHKKTRIDAVSLSSTLSQERLTWILLTLALCVHWRARHAALFWASMQVQRRVDAAYYHYLVLAKLRLKLNKIWAPKNRRTHYNVDLLKEKVFCITLFNRYQVLQEAEEENLKRALRLESKKPDHPPSLWGGTSEAPRR